MQTIFEFFGPSLTLLRVRERRGEVSGQKTVAADLSSPGLSRDLDQTVARMERNDIRDGLTRSSLRSIWVGCH